MRKVLLATSVLAFAFGGTAFAADTETTTITAVVPELCTITDPADILLPGTTTGTNGSSSFTFTCNFGGSGAPTPLAVTFDSQNGGLNNPADVGFDRGYTIAYNGGLPFTAALAEAGVSIPETSPSPGAGVLRSFVVALTENLPVAGTYTDILTVSIAP